MSELLQYVVMNLVSQPDLVKVEETSDKSGRLLTVYVDDKDLGHIIGKDGTVAKAIRTLVRSMAKPRERVSVKFLAL